MSPLQFCFELFLLGTAPLSLFLSLISLFLSFTFILYLVHSLPTPDGWTYRTDPNEILLRSAIFVRWQLCQKLTISSTMGSVFHADATQIMFCVILWKLLAWLRYNVKPIYVCWLSIDGGISKGPQTQPTKQQRQQNPLNRHITCTTANIHTHTTRT